MLRTVTHGMSHSLSFEDPEGDVVEVYGKTGGNVPQDFRAPIDLKRRPTRP
jgi:hypothetical protein